jgi:hypothetical protein
MSPLGFGCASVMGKIGLSDSLRAMALAFDLGVTHFDVARSYGFGRAESLLGRFIAGRRDRVTIATKFGVVPPHLGLKARMAMPMARVLARRLPALQKRLRGESGRLLAEHRFDADYARLALHTSLSQLRTDHVDMYFLHEPPPLPAALMDDLADTLDTLVREGKVRRWGIAYGDPADHAHFAGWGHTLFQAEAHLDKAKEWSALRNDTRLRIAMRPFAGGPRSAGGAALQQRLRSLLAQQVGLIDVERWAALAPLGVSSCLTGAGGTTVCAMFSESSIRTNVAAMQAVAAMSNTERSFFEGLLADATAATPRSLAPQTETAIR